MELFVCVTCVLIGGFAIYGGAVWYKQGRK